MSTGTGLNVSKANLYAVLANPPGVNISKANLYAVLNSTNVTPPIWGTFTFANGFVGLAYSQAWDMPTSAQVVSYTVLSGSLPTGLSITALAGNQAKLSGTPTATGTYSFTLRASNAYGTADQPFTITISTPSVGGGGSYTFTS